MKVVIDTNILVSTLISSDGIVGSFLLKDLQDVEKLSCYYLYVELFDKKEKMLKVSGLAESDFLDLMYLIIKRLTFVNENQITAENWQQAVDLTTGIDVKDVSFVALAIQADAVLWTGDKKLYKGLKEKGFSNVVNREELRELIKR